MKQWYHACLATFMPFRRFSGTPHDRCVFFTPWESQELPRRENTVQNIAKHYLCIGSTNITHFDPNLRDLCMIMGVLTVLGSKCTSSREKSGKVKMVPKCFISREGVWWWFGHSWAVLRRLCYFLPVAIVYPKIVIFRPSQHQIGSWRRLKWP